MPVQRRTVLLVDDEEMLRRLLTRMLTQAGCEVVAAENGVAALEAVPKIDRSLSLVITDIHMPVMSGLEFSRAFRSTRPGVPILYISGRDPGAAIDAVPEDALLRKPFRGEVFLDMVERMLGPAT